VESNTSQCEIVAGLALPLAALACQVSVDPDTLAATW